MARQLTVWKENPGANYSHITDSPKLFEFVSSLRDSGSNWIFPFDVVQHIFETLRLQLSYLFMDALACRLQLGAGGIPPNFRDLPGTQLRLVIERPPGWEYLLFGEALTHEIASCADIRRDWKYEIAAGPGVLMTPRSFSDWVRAKNEEALRLMDIVHQIIDKALPQAFGPPGESGDAEAILYCARRLAGLYKNAMEWRLDFLRVKVHEELEDLKSLSARMCSNIVHEIEEFALKLNRELKQAVASANSGKETKETRVELKLTLTAPDTAGLQKELDRLRDLIESGRLA